LHTRQITQGPAGVATYPADVRYAWPSEFDLMAQLAGLDLMGRWAGFQSQPFNSASTGTRLRLGGPARPPGRPA
jgi:hypothetical protein